MSSSGSRDDQLLSTVASDVASKEGEVTGDAGRSLRENSCTPVIGRRDGRAGVDCLLGEKERDGGDVREPNSRTANEDDDQVGWKSLTDGEPKGTEKKVICATEKMI